jgi:hypothetical protein
LDKRRINNNRLIETEKNINTIIRYLRRHMLQKEKTIDENEKKMLFWREFERKYDWYKRMEGGELSCGFSFSSIFNNVMKTYIDEGLSWQKFKEECLSDVDMFARYPELKADEIINACYRGFKDGEKGLENYLFWKQFKESTIVEYNDQLTFWKQFIEDYDRRRSDNFNYTISKPDVFGYVRNETMKCDTEGNLSWQDFQKKHLGSIDIVAEVLESDREEIIDGCYDGFIRGRELRREYLSWEEFREQYLIKAEYIARVYGLNRETIIKCLNDISDSSDKKSEDINDDYSFICGVIRYAMDNHTGEWGRRLRDKLFGDKNAITWFKEIYRLLYFERIFGGERFFKKIAGYGGRRSEAGKGDLVDIYLMNGMGDCTLISPTVGEDFAECGYSMVVKVKHWPHVTEEEVIKGLRDLADSLEESFINCYETSGGFVVDDRKEVQAILCGIHKADYAFYCTVSTHPHFPLERAIKEVGWIHPKVSLDSGLREMLQKGWPDLYERVLDRELSPFEALLKTGWVDSEDLYEIIGKNG